MPVRCEGYRRSGGAFTLGPVTWLHCEANAVVAVVAEQNKQKASFPACIRCWNEAIENPDITVIDVTPIVEE